MATGQTVLNWMEILHPELQLQTGEVSVTQGLLAANAAQDYFETIASSYADVFGGSIGTVTTAASTESTSFPTGLLRLDKLSFIDPNTSRPTYDLKLITDVGGHSANNYWPINLVSTVPTGRPRAYWTNGSNIYWDPLPNGTHTIRYYGFVAATDITALGTFLYPDACIVPFASFACKLLRSGLDDDVSQLGTVAKDMFEPLLVQLTRFKRDTPPTLIYSRGHDT